MQQGGSQYGLSLPEMTPFGSSGAGGRAPVLGISSSERPQPPLVAPPAAHHSLAEVASSAISRPPPRSSSFEDLAGPAAASGGFPDDDALAAVGDEAERGAVPGNRWPRQETLALLKMRSEMDAAFREATFKGPLWEEVSRKLAEIGYMRSAKKCKEKFENVQKYYKRTKDGRAGRQDGKNYRFFNQLEALHGGGGGGGASPSAAAPTVSASAPVSAPIASSIGIDLLGSAGRLQPTPLNAAPPSSVGAEMRRPPEFMAGLTSGGLSFSSDSASLSSDSEEGGPPTKSSSLKRKRRGGGSQKMMAFFEGLMKQVMERQEAMQQRFLETIEKREQDKMIREEAWKRQEMARLNREHERMAQERAVAASRDAAIIAFLHKATGQTVHVAAPPVSAAPSPAAAEQHPAASAPSSAPQQTEQRAHRQGGAEPVICTQSSSPMDAGPVPSAPPEIVGGAGIGSGPMEPASSRWPKAEVHALISLRSGLEPRYQEVGLKGPLWEEIAAEMQSMGYHRSAKRCKEKWENINKYFKKVKEGSKRRRAGDSNTCPYFHQLEALYRSKTTLAGAGPSGVVAAGIGSSPPQGRPPSPAGKQPRTAATEAETKNGDGSRNGGGGGGGGGGVDPDGSEGSALQINGGFAASFFGDDSGGGAPAKKPEDVMKDPMAQQQEQRSHAVPEAREWPEDQAGSDTVDQEDDEEDDEGDGKMAYKIEYQQSRPGVNGTSGKQSTAAMASAAATGSFMAMVQ